MGVASLRQARNRTLTGLFGYDGLLLSPLCSPALRSADDRATRNGGGWRYTGNNDHSNPAQRSSPGPLNWATARQCGIMRPILAISPTLRL